MTMNQFERDYRICVQNVADGAEVPERRVREVCRSPGATLPQFRGRR